MKWPPEKRPGAMLPASGAKLTGLSQSNSGVALAQACKHRATVTQQEPRGATHFSREICLECGAFVRWLPRPETIERERVNAFRLARLGMCGGLSKWERSFVHHVSQQRKLSPRQQLVLVRLCAQYLEAKTP